MHREGTTLSLVRSNVLPPLPPIEPNSGGKRPVHPAHLGLTVSSQTEIEALHRKIQNTSSTVSAPKLHRDGSYGFYFLDTEGNQLECIFIPHAPMSLRETTVGAILLAHGSADPSWSKPFENLLARFRENAPGVSCELAFMEGTPPTLVDAVGALLKKDGKLKSVRIVPVLWASGTHLKKDIPRLMAEAASLFPTVSLTLSAPLGETGVVQDSLVVAAISALAENA